MDQCISKVLSFPPSHQASTLTRWQSLLAGIACVEHLVHASDRVGDWVDGRHVVGESVDILRKVGGTDGNANERKSGVFVEHHREPVLVSGRVCAFALLHVVGASVGQSNTDTVNRLVACREVDGDGGT